MNTYTIDENNSGQRLDRYLSKIMPLADTNFLQKMLRKKRIKLNNNRANPRDMVKNGDTLQIYFSEETIDDFQKKEIIRHFDLSPEIKKIFEPPVYEDAHILVINKPVGLLTQADASGDLSLIDAARVYLKKTSDDTPFKTVVSNRLDRNTSGIILMPKDYLTLQNVNAAIRERQALKEYHTIVYGALKKSGELTGYLSKDRAENKSFISANKSADSKPVRMGYRPLLSFAGYTLLEIILYTGRSHQIRSQLADFGYPVLGDNKYGNLSLNRQLNQKYGLKHHLLHSRHYAIPSMDYDFVADYPPLFRHILHDFKLGSESI